ncbi:DNA polymerase III subunit epsilon [Catellatospora sp. TT07R-123]|uniref:exonuclease domain-containing protein n=1 Tax=Catellatospora sp. TT07R-123 TaxID=2733863 RepID=UPI001B2053A1|nr:exonuclease domain-containing protein [Catellatospora sp. TT07R-123]GHJ42686.1 DNA polymerase III subunit epsilon [Catellatospora sp. TT07R-123]
MYGQAPALFGYGTTDPDGHRLPRTFVVIDLETTGLADDDRIVEIAMARVEDGAVVDEWATLIDPGRDPGPTYLHHISADMLLGAPTFAQMAPEILARLDGAVVVAHHAPFEERFLAYEFARARVATPVIPALCTLRLARAVLASPNYKLSTCCEISGITLYDAHTALGDVRATAMLLPRLLAQSPEITYPVPAAVLPRQRTGATPRTRVTNLRKGADGWMRSLLTKLPYSMADHDPVGAQPYLDALADALVDGRLTGRKTRHLGRLAGRAGMGAAQVAALHHRFLDGLRDAAAAQPELSAEQQRQLVTVARLLDLPDYFADLVTAVAEPGRAVGPRVWCSPAVPAQVRRRLGEAGYRLAVNLTRSLATVVVAESDTDDARVRRARELGLSETPVDELDRLLPAPQQRPQAELLPAPVAPAGWYTDPTGRHYYRYWDGRSWTGQVSPGDGSRSSDPLG